MTDITVSNVTELYEALAAATGGETIRLKPGVYDKISLTDKQNFDVQFASNVTITSADPDQPAEIKSLQVAHAANITFDNLLFDADYAGDQVFYGSFAVSSSTDITIKNSVFEGEIATSGAEERVGYATGKGLNTAANTRLTIENNEFTDWHRALIVDSSHDVIVRGNEIHNISSDGMDFAHNTSLLIEDNYIHDFYISYAAGDHADMIQFWTTGGSSPTTDVIIRGNILDIGDGEEAQAIFMRNEMVDLGYAGEEMFYQNILIEENVILNSHIHGITVGETDGLVIRNNSVLSVSPNDPAYSLTPQIIVAKTSKDVAVLDNVAHAVSGENGQADWDVSGNVYVQNKNPGDDGFYGTQFVTSTLTGGGVQEFTVLPDSEIAKTGAGASLLQYDHTPDSLTPMFEIHSDVSIEQNLFFDASLSLDTGGTDLPEGTVFAWDFGDGTTGTGEKVFHTYADPGHYVAKLTVTLPDGTKVSDISDVDVGGSGLLSFDGTDTQFHSLGYGEQTALGGLESFMVATDSGHALDLGGENGTPQIARETLARLFEADDFGLAMNLQADQPGVSAGAVARITSSMIIRVEADGDLKVQLWLDTGFVQLSTSGQSLNDGAAHDILVKLDRDAGELRIEVDGVVAAAMPAAGALPTMGYWDMSLGDTWGGVHFDGKLNSLALDVAGLDYSAYVPDSDTSGKLTHYGSTGDDLMGGQAGKDRLFGYEGEDEIAGGAGHDVINGGTGADLLYGNGGNDRVLGGRGADTVFLGNGDDVFIDHIRAEADRVFAGRGEDVITGKGGHDWFYGQAGNDSIRGGAGNDRIFGGGEHDSLYGDEGNDRISGGSGNDLIDGGAGDDRLNGGDGDDTFVFDFGADRIHDYGTGNDSLELDAALWNEQPMTVAQVLDFASTDGTDTVFDFGSGNTLTLEGYSDILALENSISIF